jgi:hypothetical protein
MRKTIVQAAIAALLLGVSTAAVRAEGAVAAPVPDAPKFDAQGQVTFVGIGDILEYKALPEYHEPDYIKAMVDAGKLPPVKDRLPKEPMVYKTGNMKDGIGVYGDAPRHRRPSGRLELLGRSVAGLGRHRHRLAGMPDPHRSALPGQGGRTSAAAKRRQIMGMVGRRQVADHAPH